MSCSLSDIFDLEGYYDDTNPSRSYGEDSSMKRSKFEVVGNTSNPNSSLALDIEGPTHNPKHFNVGVTADIYKFQVGPIFNVFGRQEEEFHASASDNYSPVEFPSTPFKRPAPPLPKHFKWINFSSATASPRRSRAYAQKQSNSERTAKGKGPKAAAVPVKIKDEPLARGAKRRKTINSACAADGLVPFVTDWAPVRNSAFPAPVASSHCSDSGGPSTPCQPPKAIPTRKRKVKENNKDIEQQWSSEWKHVPNEGFSCRIAKGKTEYRCDLCPQISTRKGDMRTHRFKLQHTAKSFFCTNAGCSKRYTRPDAVKRHEKICQLRPSTLTTSP
ncbi:hypothetical protein BYT27DRAFT_7336982 [Phlegmacium glaucopus]|nr:hypothetical protein BYT27DRAFT_7336982 [Phlegmacium glaucopus]